MVAVAYQSICLLELSITKLKSQFKLGFTKAELELVHYKSGPLESLHCRYLAVQEKGWLGVNLKI